MSMQQWFDALRMSFSNFYVPQVRNEEDWKMVASYIKNYSEFKGKVPDIRGYSDWRAWAQDFYKMVGA